MTRARILADYVAGGTTAAEFDYMDGVTSNVQTQLNAKEPAFASGTKMIFNQTAAPTGWTKVTGSGNDTALRVTTGTVGTGGTVAFETAFASHTPTASSGAVSEHTLTTAQMPSHGHGHSWYTVTSTAGGTHTQRLSNAGTGYYDNALNNVGSINNTGSSNSHNHGMTQPTISAINLDVSYVDVIIATKD